MRILVFGLIAVLLLLGVAAFFLPYLLKRYIEKHSVEWIGRTVTIDNIILNPFTFTYAVNDVKCSERGTEETFVSWKSIAVKSNLWNGFRNKNWRFRELRVVDPYVHISQKEHASTSVIYWNWAETTPRLPPTPRRSGSAWRTSTLPAAASCMPATC
ncbi:MAG: hypothetical protein IPL86_07920 [Flavobacteriales bacterium]|nr:hypothetical protein [Flavobacteriales bacterium]